MDCKTRICAALALALLASVPSGCRKADPFTRELGLQSRRVVLDAGTGITPVMVFSNTAWTVKFTEEVSWAGIDRLSGTGSSGIYFSYGANYGRARKVSIAFAAGASRDTVVMIQKGGLENASITVSPQSVTLSAEASRGSASVKTNLREDLPSVVCSVEYTEGDPDWISGVSLEEGTLGFDAAANPAPSSRKATITVSHTDAEDVQIKATLQIIQNPA